MSRVFFGVEKGVDIFAENGAVQARILTGTAAPDGLGDQSSAPIGSLYIRSGTGQMYQKIANAGNSADWSQFGNITLDELHWRNEYVRAATNDSVSAGVVDPTGFSDNESGIDGNDFAVGEYLIGDVNGVPALFEVTVVTGPTSITVAAAGISIANGDTFVVQSYLPDAGSAQEAQAILHIPVAGSPGVKIGDFNWAIATGINLSGAYVAASGNVAANDTVEAAIAKLDGVNDNQDTLLGTAQGAVDLGTFTGDIIPDNSTVKSALQSLETELVDTRQNVDDLITLSGVAENSTNFGTFTGVSLADNQTAKQLYQRIETLLEQMRGVQSTGITTATTVDSVPHASVKAVKWLVEAFEEATPANRQAMEVFALTDGTNVDDTISGKLKLGSNFNLTISVDISGADMRLRAASTTAGVTVTARRIEVVKSVL